MAAQFTPSIRARFLQLVADHGPLMSKHANAVGVTYQTVNGHLRKDEVFAEEFEDARQRYVDSLQSEVHRRGVEGYEEPIYYQGVEVGRQRKYSDALLALHIKRHDPAYRDKGAMDLNIGGGVLVVQPQAEDAKAWLDKYAGQPPKDNDDESTGTRTTRA